MKLLIRRAGPDDAAEIHRFIKLLAAYEREPDAVEATPESLRAQLSAARPPFECLLAEHDGRAIGFALFFHNFSTWRGRPGIYLEDLFVDPASRGIGAGKALLIELARIARERQCPRMEWVVLDWNRSAIEFYESLGASPLDGWTVFRLADDAIGRLAKQRHAADS